MVEDPFHIDDQPVVEKLDRTRPFGTVAGDQVKRYFQDGKYYDYTDTLVEEA